MGFNQQRSNSVVCGMLAPPSATGRKGRRFSCPPAYAVENAVMIKRPPFTQTEFDELHLTSEEEHDKSFAEVLKKKCACTRQKLWKIFSSYLPIIKVLRYYNVKENMVIDIMAGITIGILHIPQALAFGLLTSVKIENGLYTSVWPVLLYVFFGTSAHVSMGTSAVICIVTAAVVDRQADAFKAANEHLLVAATSGNSSNVTVEWEDIPEFMDYKEATAMGIAFFTGAILLAMGLLKLGFITAYLSDSFFSAFTSGAGVHIATSQIPGILGLKVPRYGGVLKIVKTYAAIFGAIEEANLTALIVALISGATILFVKDVINERLKNKLPIPIPIELFVVIFATLASYFMNMSEIYDVDIVKHIPSDLPLPIIPSMEGVETYIVDCFVLAILIFANTIAMAKVCAKRHNYEVNDSQELIAYGMCNFASSFLRCFPSSVAPPRSMVASSMNTKTTLCGVFSTALLILLIVAMSKLFEPLPKPALSAIIVVALKGLFIQLKDCVKFWRVNKIDFVIWFFTLASVVFLDIDFGLGIGVVVSLITVVFQAQFARGYRVGRTIKDNVTVEHKRYADSMEVSGIKVFRFHSNIFFANAEIFRTSLYRHTVNPKKLLKFIKKQERKRAKTIKAVKRVSVDNQVHYDNKSDSGAVKTDEPTKIDINIILPNGTTQSSGPDIAPLTTGNVSQLPNRRNFPPVERTSSNGSRSNGSRRSSLTGLDNLAFSTKDDMFTGVKGLEAPGEFNLYRRNMSISTFATMMSDDEQEDPEDGTELVTDERVQRMRRIHHVVLDMSTANYVDISGANVLSYISKEYEHVNIKLFLANVSYDVRQTMQQAGTFDTIPQDRVFIDVHDAVAVAKLEMMLPLPEEGFDDFTMDEAVEDKYISKM